MNPVILYDANKLPMAVQDGVAIPANTQGILILGSDGTNSRNIKVSSTGVISVDGSAATQPVSGTVTANQGTPGIVSNAWHTKISNGTDIAEVKASSVAPTATDKALVVVLSPNQQPIPTTQTPANATTAVSHGRVLGTNGVLSAVRATTYTEQTVNFTGSVKSSSASDAAAGTGARTIKITYVDSTGATSGTETATLNGTTAVNLVSTNKCFIEKIEVLTVGSGGANAGTITLFTGANGTGTTVGTIAVGTIVAAVGDNQTFWAHHYVVTGKTCNLYNMTIGTNGNQNSIGFLRTKDPTSTNAAELQLTDVIVAGLNSDSDERAYASPISVVGPARITMYIVPSGSNTNFFASFQYADL